MVILWFCEFFKADKKFVLFFQFTLNKYINAIIMYSQRIACIIRWWLKYKTVSNDGKIDYISSLSISNNNLPSSALE